jgi:hypothetical protein
MTADDLISARGKLTLATALSDNRIHIGHLDSTLHTVTARNLLGFYILEPARVSAAIGLADGGEITAFVGHAEPGVTYNWDYTYDPNGGPTGTGQLTVNIEGLGTAVITLIAHQRGTGFSLNGFGMVNPGAGSSVPDTGEVYIDSVEYKAVGELPRIQAPASVLSLVGQTNKAITISIPATLNATREATVKVTSLDPSVAVPAGADTNGIVVLAFPAGGPTAQSFNLVAIKAGTTSLVLTNDQGVTAQNDIAVIVVASQQTILKTEEFSSANAARTNGWVEHLSRQDENNYGYSDTDNNGVGAGEAGGAFTRTSLNRSYYADVFGRRLTLNDTITARGKFIPGAGAY